MNPVFKYFDLILWLNAISCVFLSCIQGMITTYIFKSSKPFSWYLELHIYEIAPHFENNYY
jgi:hypothetical protein